MQMPVQLGVPTSHFYICFFVDGLLGSEANCFLKRMACRLWDKSYGEVLGWIHAWLTFAIYTVCICGLGLEDSTAIDLT